MRVAKKDLIYQLTREPLHEATALHLENRFIESLSTALEDCSVLVALRLSDNRLGSVARPALEGCPCLYSLDLSNNVVASTDGICDYSVLGHLNLSGNRLDVEQLGRMQHMHILELETFGNSKLRYSSSSIISEQSVYRNKVLQAVPNAWVLDGHFVTASERAGLPPPPNPSSSTPPPPPPSSPASQFLTTVLPNAPARNQSALDVYRLSFLLLHHDASATRHNYASSRQVHRPAPSRKPLSRAEYLSALPAALRLDIACLMACSVDFPVPNRVLSESLHVLLVSGGAPQPQLQVAEDLSTLPIYCRSALISLLDELAAADLRPIRPDEDGSRPLNSSSPHVSAYGTRLAALPSATRYALAASYDAQSLALLSTLSPPPSRFTSGATAQRQSSAFSARCRHGVILLSRSPSCPPLLVQEGKQATAEMQKAYDTIKPMLEAAGFGEADLGLKDRTDDSFKPGRAQPRRPYRQFWNEGGSAPMGSELNLRPDQQQQDDQHMHAFDARRPPSPDQLPHSHYLRTPKLSESVVIALGVFGVVSAVAEDGANVLTVSVHISQSDAAAPKVNETIIVQREDLVWDPRGTWSTVEALQQRNEQRKDVFQHVASLPSLRFDISGRPILLDPLVSAATLQAVREVGPVAEIPRPKVVDLFSADRAWDAAFVLAPPPLINVMNRTVPGALWNRGDEIPFNVTQEEDFIPQASQVLPAESRQLPRVSTARVAGKSRQQGSAALDSGPSMMSSTVGSASVRDKFGVGRTELYDEFRQLMKEMGSVKPDPYLARRKVDVASMLTHIQARKNQLKATDDPSEIDDEGTDSVSAAGVSGSPSSAGNNSKIFGLTNVEISDPNSAPPTRDGGSVVPLEAGVFPESSFITAASEDSLAFSPALTRELSSSVYMSVQPPNVGSENPEMDLKTLEQQLGLSQLEGKGPYSIYKRPPRKIGPRPWYVKPGKNHMLVSSASVQHLSKHFFGQESLDKRPPPLTSCAPKTGEPGYGRLMLNDGLDDSPIPNSSGGDRASRGKDSPEARAQLYSAEAKRWESRFGVRSRGGSRIPLRTEDEVVAKAAIYDKSHPKPIVDVDATMFIKRIGPPGTSENLQTMQEERAMLDSREAEENRFKRQLAASQSMPSLLSPSVVVVSDAPTLPKSRLMQTLASRAKQKASAKVGAWHAVDALGTGW